FVQAEEVIRDFHVTGVQTCALPICPPATLLVDTPQPASRTRALHGAARQWPALLSLAMLLVVLLAALFPHALSPHEPAKQNLAVIGRASGRERMVTLPGTAILF